MAACTSRGPSDSLPDQKEIVINNDCENAPADVPFWINKATVVKEMAYSGELSSRIDSSALYSYGFESRLKDIRSALPDSVFFSALIFSKNKNPEIYFVIDISLDGEKLYWNSCNLSNQIDQPRKWNKVRVAFGIPRSINPNGTLKLFGWNPNKQLAWLDDFSVELKYK